MAIFKISTLDNVSSLNDSDKLLVSKDVGGRYSYRNINFDDLKIQVSSGFQDDIQAVRDDLGLSVGNLQQDILSAVGASVTVANAYTDGVISNYTTTEKLTGFVVQETAKNYPIQLSTDGTAYVHVNWTGGSASDVAVDDSTIKKMTDGTSRIYVNEITKNKIKDFPTSLSDFNNDPGYVTQSVVEPVQNRVSTIESYIPNATALSNQLADKNFVNSSIATETANFISTFTDFDVLSSTPATNNDYAFLSVVVDGNSQFKRYKYSGKESKWKYEYTLNNSSFNSDQWNAINSKITEEKVNTFEALSGTVDKRLESYATKTELGTVDGKFANYTTTTDLASSYLTKTDAGTTYATKTELGTVDGKFTKYTTTTDLASSYLSKSDASTTYLSKTDAGTTYATKSELNTVDGKFSNYTSTTDLASNYLSKSDASTTYSTKTELGTVDGKFVNYTTTSDLTTNYLTKTDAGTTYATKTELGTVDGKFSNYTTTANLTANYLTKSAAETTYATKSSLETVDGKFANYTTTTDLASSYLTKNDASTTYLTKSDAETTYATKTALETVDNRFDDYTTTDDLSTTYMTKEAMTAFKSQLKGALDGTFSTLSGNAIDGYNIDINQVISCLNNIYNIVK